MQPELIRWDWREQPRIKAIADAVREQSGGKVIISEIDTQSDEYMIAIADHVVDQGEALALLDDLEGLDDEDEAEG